MNAMKIAELKALGFSDDDIAAMLDQAARTEKSADDWQVAYKQADAAGDTSGDGLSLTTEDLDAIRAMIVSAVQEATGQGSPPVATAKAARPWSFADTCRGDLRSDMTPR